MPEQTEVAAQEVATEQTTTAQAATVDETLGKDGKPFDPARAQALIDKLTEENKQLKPKAKLADELTAKEKLKADAELTETERLKNQLAEQQKINLGTMAENAALAAGLPKEFGERLKGSTKTELEADAAEFAKLFPEKVAQKIVTKVSPTNPQNAQQNETLEQQKARLFGSSKVNIFDPAQAREKGGGVY